MKVPAFSGCAALILALLFACAQKPLTPERAGSLEPVAALSFLGDELALSAQTGSLLDARTHRVKVESWKLDDSFRVLVEEELKDRHRQSQTLGLAPEQLTRALSIRESRWKKVAGKRSQALMELLFRKAEEQGVKSLLLLTPNPEQGGFVQKKGAMGVACAEGQNASGRAYAYFAAEFSLWSVADRKILFRELVSPSLTEAMTFADCSALVSLAEPERQLEDPVKKTLGLVLGALLDKLGWKRPGQ